MIVLKILLWILLILLLLVLLILFIPVRYQFEARCGSGEAEKKLSVRSFRQNMMITAGASWSAGFLRIRYVYSEGGGKPELRILGIRVPIPGSKKRNEKKKKTKPAKDKGHARSGIMERISQAFRLYDKIDKQALAETAAKLLRKGIRLVRGILPRKLYAEGVIGTGDPADTGKVFMAAGLLASAAGKGWDLRLEPDMEQARIRLNAGGSGRIFIFRILLFLLWILTDRDMAAIRKARRDAAGKKEHERTEGEPLSGTDQFDDGERAGRTDDEDRGRGTAAGR